ncbi:MAG: GAF domain-containing protein [Acidobacteriota bacterium]|nr:GAF domain-containing protein [Acidobacteriota bacterium]
MATPPVGATAARPPATPDPAPDRPRERHPSSWSPVIETGLYIACVLAADAIWGRGNRFAHVEPHPFWGVVLLMAVHYGTREGLLATGACTVALLVGNLPSQSLDQNIHDYSLQVLSRPLLWMAAALVLGELRMRHRHEHGEALERLSNAERRVGLLANAHKDLSAAKERLETRLAGQVRTATGLFEAARALETLEPGKVLAGAADLVEVALQATSFSIFLLEGNTLVLATAQGWNDEQPHAERYAGTSPLFQQVVGGQHYISVATPEGQAVLNGHGLMAGPLIDPASGQLIGVLKIERMAFLEFNLTSLQTFRTLCGWIAAAYANAVTHKASQIEDETTRLYGMKFLDTQAAYVTELALRFGFDLTLLLFRVEVEALTEEQRREIPAALGEVSRKMLRRTDMVFSHEPPGTQFAVLLPGAPAENVAIVARKLRESLVARCGYDVACTTVVRSLSRAGEQASRQQLRGAAGERTLVASP